MNKQEIIDEIVQLLESKNNFNSAKLIKEHFTNQDKPFDRWYVSDDHPGYIAFEGSRDRYGIGVSGYWLSKYECKPNRIMIERLRLATDKEILSGLSAYATSIGIKAGVTIVDTNRSNYVLLDNKIGFVYRSNVNTLYFNGYQVMRDGKWATVVEPKRTLEEEVAAIKKHLGI
jgi:hypothetical protein